MCLEPACFSQGLQYLDARQTCDCDSAQVIRPASPDQRLEVSKNKEPPQHSEHAVRQGRATRLLRLSASAVAHWGQRPEASNLSHPPKLHALAKSCCELQVLQCNLHQGKLGCQNRNGDQRPRSRSRQDQEYNIVFGPNVLARVLEGKAQKHGQEHQ